MSAGLDWKNIREKAAYERLRELLPIAEKLGLRDTHRALRVLLRRRMEKKAWDWGILEDFVNDFKLEFSQQDPTYAEGFRILDEIFDATFAVKKRKGKRIDLLAVKWSPEEHAFLDASLGVVMTKAQKASDPVTFALLAGLGHIIRYKTKGAFARRRIELWTRPSVPDRKRREQVAEDFLAVKRKGTDGRADTTHIRNAFAHAHFEFEADKRIRLWDEKDGKKTYHAVLNIADLIGLTNMFEKKLAIAEVYPSLLVAVEDLYSVYKREWKPFRR